MRPTVGEKCSMSSSIICKVAKLLDTKEHITNFQDTHSKIGLNVTYIWVKIVARKLSKIFISKTDIYGRGHSEFFTNCHVSWDTLYSDWLSSQNSQGQGVESVPFFWIFQTGKRSVSNDVFLLLNYIV